MKKNTDKQNRGPQNKKKRFGTPKRQNNRQGRPKRTSKLEPEMLVKTAAPVENTVYVSERTIAELPINNQLIRRLEGKGFVRPTEIQDRTLEIALQGRDILGIAQTGTGKTGAFLMPIINYLLKNPKKKNHALILVPTRELALQVEEEFKSMTKGLRLYSACFIGGTNINRDINTLRRAMHVVIGTPGRLLDLEGRKALNFSGFNTLVLDEFDRMLDMGFSRDMDRIVGAMKNRRQTMLFSATIDRSQQQRVNNMLNDAETVKVSQGDVTGDHIEQKIIRLDKGENKFNKLLNMLDHDDFAKVLIFDETKHRVKRLCKQLNAAGISSGQIQGNMSQNARQMALKDFKKGKTRVLVASDVASRGLDVDDISHVINYQLPMSYDTYIHRIGRTGRAGNKGMAYTFVS